MAACQTSQDVLESSEVTPYRPRQNQYSVASSSNTKSTTATIRHSSSEVQKENQNASIPDSFLHLIRRIVIATTDLGISSTCALEMSHFDPNPLEFIGRGKTFYVTRLQLDPVVRVHHPASGPARLVEVFKLSRDQQSKNEAQFVIRKLPLVEFSSHGKPKDKANETRLKAILLEIQALTHKPLYQHDNIIDYLGVTWECEIGGIDDLKHEIPPPVTRIPALLLKNAVFGSLDHFMKTEVYATLSVEKRMGLCRDVAEGLFALHACWIVHGDLKPDNILIDEGRDGIGYTAKLADFGFSVTQSQGFESSRSPTVGDLDRAAWRLTGRTWPWNDPNFHRSHTWDGLKKTDVFSYGLLMWSILTGDKVLVLFDINGDDIQDRQNPTSRRMVEDLKNDGTLGRNASTYFTTLDPLVHLLVQILFEISLHPSITIRASMEEICGVWDMWFNDSRSRPTARFGPLTSSSRLPFQYIVSGTQWFPDMIKGQFTTLSSEEARTMNTQRAVEILAFRSLSHIIGWGVEQDITKAKQTIDEAASLNSYITTLQAMFLDDAGRKDRNLAKALAGKCTKYEQAIFERLQRVVRNSCSYEAVLQLNRYFPKETSGSELFYKIRTMQWRLKIFENTQTLDEMAKLACINNITLGQYQLQRIKERFQMPAVRKRGLNMLHYAVYVGFVDGLQSLLESSEFDPHWLQERTSRGDTPVHVACRLGGLRASKLLIKAGSDITAMSNDGGESILHFLCDFEDEEEAAELANIVFALQPDISVNTVAIRFDVSDGLVNILPQLSGTPLTHAVIRNNYAVAKILLNHGADPHYKVERSKSPSVAAALGHCIEMLELFASYTPGAEEWGKTDLLYHAILCNYAFQRLYLHGPKYPLNMRRTIDFLLERIPNTPVSLFTPPKGKQKSILTVAVQHADEDTLEHLLIRLQAIPTEVINACTDNDTLLCRAVTIGSLAKFKLLLKHGADPHIPSNKPPLLLCCGTFGGPSVVGMVQELLKYGVPIVEGPEHYWSALECAVLSGQFEVARLLLEAAANANSSNDQGRTVIGSVVRICSPNTVSMLRLLLDQIPEKQRPNFIGNTKFNYTVFHILAKVANATYFYDRHVMLDIFDFLVERFPDPAVLNAVDNMGHSTALHVAVYCSNLTAVRRLLQVPGIDIMKRTRSPEGRTAYDYAVLKLTREVPKAVLEKGPVVVQQFMADRYEIRDILATAMGLGSTLRAGFRAGETTDQASVNVKEATEGPKAEIKDSEEKMKESPDKRITKTDGKINEGVEAVDGHADRMNEQGVHVAYKKPSTSWHHIHTESTISRARIRH